MEDEGDSMEGLDATRGTDDDDLYGDLYADIGQGKKALKTELQELEERYQQSQGQVQELSEKNAKLEEERRVLIKNISALFKTAQMEVKRKDVQISELRQDLAKARQFIESKLKRPASRERDRGVATMKSEGREEEQSRSTEGVGLRRADDSHADGPPRRPPVQADRFSSRGPERDTQLPPERSRFERS